jgi:hypothetical protein
MMFMTSKAAGLAACATLCAFAAIGILVSVVLIAWIITLATNIPFTITLGGEMLLLVCTTKLVYDAIKIESLDMDWDDEDLDV